MSKASVATTAVPLSHLRFTERVDFNGPCRAPREVVTGHDAARALRFMSALHWHLNGEEFAQLFDANVIADRIMAAMAALEEFENSHVDAEDVRLLKDVMTFLVARLRLARLSNDELDQWYTVELTKGA